MASIGVLDPIAIQQWFDNNGNPLAGGKMYFYLAGTDTPTPVFHEQSLLTPLANPLVLDAGGRAPIHYLDAISYKEVLKDANGVTIWTADNVTSPIALRGVNQSISLGGVQNDVVIQPGLVSTVVFSNSTPLTITGFAGGTPGQLLVLRAAHTGQVDLLHQDSRSAEGNKLVNVVTSGPTTLTGARGSAIYMYHEAGFWFLLNHEQGAWINVPYSAGNFTVQGSGSWTVEAGDVRVLAYYLQGTTLLVTCNIAEATLAGGPNYLNIAGQPYQFAQNVVALPALMAYTGTYIGGHVVLNVNQSILSLARADNTVFPDTTNAHAVLFQVQGNVM